VEKQVFSLASREEKRFVIGYLLLWTFLIVGNLWWRPHYRIIAALEVALLLAVMALRYWSNRVRKLEVSDQGLVMKSWLRKPVSIDWNMVSSVKRGYEVLSFSLNKRFLSAVVKDVAGQRIAITGTSRDSAEIIDILKQRLPESVFQA
jgi:hypothetical protein